MRSLLKFRLALLTIGLICTLFTSTAKGQGRNDKNAELYFPSEQLLTVGVYYYPEAWPEAQWERDIRNIKRFGFEFIHLGEFAWAFMEPEEGKYDFGWLVPVVELARRNTVL